MSKTLGLILLLATGPLSAQCLEVVERHFEFDDDDVAPSIAWEVVVENRCADPYTADMRLHLVDGEGETLQEISELLTVPREGRATSERSSIISKRYRDEVEGLEVELEERKRPM